MRAVCGESLEQTCERTNEGGMRAPGEKKFFVALQQRCEKQQVSKRESSIRLFFFRFGGGFGNESL